MTSPRGILQVGLGGFGRNHLRAWHELGLGDRLFIADLDPQRHAEAHLFNLPPQRVGKDYRAFLDQVEVVDVVTPSTSHFQICSEALAAGKHVFVEKPMTMTAEEAQRLAAQVRETARTLQVGYYYRFHPISVYLHQAVARGDLGELRYLSGRFMGFKRARTDVGVTHTDGIHFLDLFNWLLGAPPQEVYTVTRDHFRRGMEDFSIVLLTYPGDVVAQVESGYIQPGRWRDKVVPNAFTSKEVFLCGTRATAEADFETESLMLHDVHHEFLNNTWTPVMGRSLAHNAGTATPLQMVSAELRAFLDCAGSARRPGADAVGSGLVLAKLMEAVYESARRHRPVSLHWSPEEAPSLKSP
jgi:predicted dehydrogenase